MHIVVFGLAVSSSWGNGHATLWRGLIRALARRGHRVTFFERDVPYYAASRDVTALPGGELALYTSWDDALPRARRAAAAADAVVVTSYCPDAVAASRLAAAAGPRAVRAFYDLDTPVTLARLDADEPVAYLPPDGLGDFDLVLSYTGGRALDALRERLGARVVMPLYGCVDPDVHRPGDAGGRPRADLSYIGTYAADRQEALARLFLEPARRVPGRRFALAGSQYPADFPWLANIWYCMHLSPSEHPAFYAASRLTLNVTRGAMASMGHCPSGRLFEAAACGCPVLTDAWDGLDRFFTPGEEVLVAADADDALRALALDDDTLARVARRARERTLDEHTAARRADELVAALEGAARPPARPLATTPIAPPLAAAPER
jgi:spore maturation protein CgeB